MTKISERRSRLVFETEDSVFERGKNRHVVVHAMPYVAIVRLKGSGRKLAIRWESVYIAAARIEAEQLRADRRSLLRRETERAEARAAKKAGKR